MVFGILPRFSRPGKQGASEEIPLGCLTEAFCRNSLLPVPLKSAVENTPRIYYSTIRTK